MVLALEVGSPGATRPVTVWIRSGRIRLVVIWLLLISSLLVWRTGEYYTGGVDPVVAAKAALSIVAFGLALDHAVRAESRRSLSLRSLSLISLYVVVSTIGGWAGGSLLASGVLAVRVALVAATVALVVVAYSGPQVVETAVTVLGVVGAVCALSGIGALASRGRLYGQLIPVNPNEIALMLGPAVIWLVWRMLREPTYLRHIGAVSALVLMTWLTGSRTGLIALVIALMIVLGAARKLPLSGFVALLLAVPGLFYILTVTDVVSGYLGRGGDSNVLTLNSRTIAWSAVFQAPTDFWQHWFGGGLAVKTVQVSGQYWSDQVVDSSWVSAYVQCGVCGLILMTVWVLGTVFKIGGSSRPTRSLLGALVIYAVIQSMLENGLVDSTVLFVALLMPALLVDVQDADRRVVGDSSGERRQSLVRDGGHIAGPEPRQQISTRFEVHQRQRT